MSAAANKVLVKMLDRLFAALVNGPSLNARPHASRQRVDFAQLGRLGDLAPEDALRRLLGEARQVRVAARVPPPKRRGAASRGRRFGKAGAREAEGNGNGGGGNGNGKGKGSREEASGDAAALGSAEPESRLTDAERVAERAFLDQQALLTKLRVIIDDARTYEQDTGVHILNVGFPLLSLPPGSFDARQAGSTRRVLAPIAFIPVAITLSGGATQNIRLACRGDGIDLVAPNNALLAWLEQQTGKPATPDLFADQTGDDPWREICDLVAYVCKTLDLAVPELFTEEPAAPVAPVAPAPPPLPAKPRELTGEEIDAEVAARRESELAEERGEAAAAKLPPPPTRGFAALKLQPAPRADDSGEGEKPRVATTAILG